jgi:DNA polymerase-3 subunit delta
MYFDEYIQKLAKSAWPAAVLFYGDSEGVVSEGYTHLKKAFKSKFPQGTVNVFEGGEAQFAELLSGAQTASLFANQQLLVLRNAEKALGGRSESALTRLSDYFENPSPDSTLVFVANGLRKTSKIVSYIEKKGWAVQCSDIPDWKLIPWVRQQAGAMGLEINEEACQALIQKTGTDMAYLTRALEHLSVFILPQKKPTLRDILDLPIPGTEAEIFPFLDAIGFRRTEKAIQSFNEMAPGSENGIVFMMYQRMRDLLGLAAGKAEGLNQADMTQRLGLHPFRVKSLWEQANQYSSDELKQAMNDLIQIQAGLVVGRIGKTGLSTLLEWWIVKWGKNPLAVLTANGK